MLRTFSSGLIGTLVLASAATAQSFSYSDFSSVAGLVLNQDAVQAGTSLRVSGATISEKGSAYYDQMVSVAGGFETSFDFEITQPTAGGGDGMTFIIQNAADGLAALGRHAKTLGYSQWSSETGEAIENSLVIEIDTYAGDDDISSNEISVHTNGTGENNHLEVYSLGHITPGVNMSDGFVHTMRISYTPGQLDVYLDDLVTPILSVTYDFGTGGTWIGGGTVGGLTLVGGRAYVGFTASAGGAWENHDVLSWDFDSGGGPGTQYCPGDGIAPHTLCPCANNNNGDMGGCDWGDLAFPEGGVLTATGSDSMAANDTLLIANGISNNFGIFFGADNQVNGGNGNPLNDGLRCAGGALIRLIPPTMASGNQMTLPMPLQTLDGGAAGGVTRRYQYWFRTPGGPCGQMANLTNGYEIVWLP